MVSGCGAGASPRPAPPAAVPLGHARRRERVGRPPSEGRPRIRLAGRGAGSGRTAMHPLPRSGAAVLIIEHQADDRSTPPSPQGRAKRRTPRGVGCSPEGRGLHPSPPGQGGRSEAQVGWGVSTNLPAPSFHPTRPFGSPSPVREGCTARSTPPLPLPCGEGERPRRGGIVAYEQGPPSDSVQLAPLPCRAGNRDPPALPRLGRRSSRDPSLTALRADAAR
jgi:hypothetical protein